MLFGLGVFLLLIYLAIRLLVAASTWVAGNRYRAYRLIAARYHGKYENRGLSDPPTVSFMHGGSSVRVGLAPNVPGQRLGPRTRVVARFRQGLPFRLELAPVGRPAPPQPPKGTRLVRIGTPAFDRSFVVQANDPEMARAFLDERVRATVDQLQRLGPAGGILVSINPERLLVQVDRNLAQYPEMFLSAVHHALVLHDGLQTGVASRLGQGIEIVHAGPAAEADSGPPICKVCGEPITTPGVICTSCRTPHHRDCWEFVGSCSIYGCSSKSCTPADATGSRS
ncbi:MAG: RING finger protein [Isosphaeraceae bacterium]